MPVKVVEDLPVIQLLEQEEIFTMGSKRAVTQDIRPLKIAIVNLMPNKIATELQLLRLLSQSPLQIEVDFIQTSSHQAKHTSTTYLNDFYLSYEDIKNNYYDGLIITGAPVEKMNFEEVDYWRELQAIMDWSQSHVTSNLHICWGAQAGLYHFYGVEKILYDEKIFGIFENRIVAHHPYIRGFNDYFYSPQSRYTGINEAQMQQAPIKIIADNPELGTLVAVSNDQRNLFVLGHMEYDTDTLATEYQRDLERGLTTAPPQNYYYGDPQKNIIRNTWRSEAFLLYQNWLNDVYQRTPYQLGK
ncbi:homoserine O-succinyltransferase [Enterococcus sp. HY326]|uniref:homoserine O-succinyltransferase n=1 Tax=Enterococcus sp. HY326 TaxID=2971265 RepID=UPI00223EE4DF|nr:homoserine O-succinyltransferase [Enterococcus sp. HY326]